MSQIKTGEVMKKLAASIVILFTVSIFSGNSNAWPPSSRPSSGSSSSSRPSSGSSGSSKPSSGSSSKPSTPSVRPNSPAPSKPSTPSTPSVRPNSPSARPMEKEKEVKPSVRPNSPSARPAEKEKEVKPSVRPNSSVNPNVTPKKDTNPTVSNKPSVKPSGGFDSAASTAQKKADSSAAFKAANTPKPSYTAPNGKTVKVNPNEVGVKNVRNNLNSEKYVNRTVRVENHYHTYYGPRYDYYCRQPYIYVGGGYSSLFWYSMLDWSLDRRAYWFYHNQASIDQELYQRELANNAELRREVERLRQQNVRPDPNYVDPEFKENPDLMYSNEYVGAAYNPESSNSGWTAFWVLGGLLGCAAFVYLVFFHQWKVRV